jgi:hypothetical protein
VISLDSVPNEEKLLGFLERVCAMNERFSSVILLNEKTGALEWTPLDEFTVDELVHNVTLSGRARASYSLSLRSFFGEARRH